jgi:DNA polymerase elongation subunit (family B)
MESLRGKFEPMDGHSRSIQFQITDFFVPEADKSKKSLSKKEVPDYSEEPAEYKILLYGCTMAGESICAEVINYTPYFYVRIPECFAKKDVLALKHWVTNFKLYLLDGTYHDKKYGYDRRVISKRYSDHLVSVKLEQKKEFMGFTNNKDFHFLKITVKSLGLFNSLKYFFQNPPKEFLNTYKEPFKLYESNIDPMLRFIHDMNILPCGWIEIPAKKYSLICNGSQEDGSCRTTYTVEVDYRYIKPMDSNATAPLMIMSFDIECTSSHGDFPVAIKDYLKLAKDLITVARYSTAYNEEDLVKWILTAYTEDVVVNPSAKIHRLYAKSKLQKEIVEKSLRGKLDEIYEIMQQVQKENIDEDDEEEEAEPATQKVLNSYEYKIKELLNKCLPQLQGDAIIQIGTTVHRYGSDEIVYKNIISLNTCDPIEGVEVVSCRTETELLYAWKDVLRRIDPDILMGYNIFGFDMPYIWDRAKELRVADFGIGLGRLSDRECILNVQRLSSAALGDNVLKYFDMDGVVMVDLYKVMQRNPLDSYKLDFVAKLYLGDQKNDLKPYEIFEKFKGSSYDRKVIAEYCIQDCALVNRLFHKLKVLENNNAMGNVCLVPLSYLFMRGQGVKIFSLVAQFCKNKNFAIPVLRNFRDDVDQDDDGYEGAIVLHPKEGMYLQDAITVLDYSSLYPSSMIERNLSHDCYVNDPAYDNLPDVDYCTVTYDIYEGVGDKKTKVGEKSCKFVQLPNGEKGLIPQILMKLLTQRKNTRKKIEYETIQTSQGESYSGLVSEKEDGLVITDVEKKTSVNLLKSDVVSRVETYNKFEQAVLDALQLAYKVTANSLYGQIGSKVSPIYLKEIAACTTATGRERILMAKKFVEEQYGAEVIYGDSVTGYTPITVRVNGVLIVDKIEDLALKYGNNNWIPCIEEGKQEKEACEIPDYVEVWSDKGWTPIQRVIRHTLADHKKIIRVLTHTGVVDVTDDHSLLLSTGESISPKELTVGIKLLHKHIPVSEISETINSITVDEARIMGFFMGDGSCGTYNCKYGFKSSWALNNATISRLEFYKDLCEKVYSDYHWKILDTIESSGVYKLVPMKKNNSTVRNFIDYYRSQMYSDIEKIVPSEILSSSIEVRNSFWEGLYDADGDKDKHGYIRIDQKNMISAQMIYLLATSLGYKASINTRLDKPNIFRITMTKRSQRIDPHTIKKLYEIPYEGFVYDLTTENHHFQAGVGQMIVHNTDSIFCKFTHHNEKGEKITGRETLPLGIKAGQRASNEIKSILPPPQCLEYEKTFFPFIIFSKKRYVGLLYEDDANKKPKQKSMGIVLKRRDNAPIVKKIYGGIIDILMNKYDLKLSVEFLQEELQKLVSGKHPLEELIITKTLKGSYKDRTKIAHCVLADRMGERDAGNKPQINDRIPYIYIQTNGEVKLQGDRIEHPEFVRENNLTPDYQFYITNQLMKPICQMYALCVEQLPNYTYPPSYWIQWDEELKQNKIYENDTKRKNRIDALREQEVEHLLFDPYLEKKRKVRTLASETPHPKVKKVIPKHSVNMDAPKLKFKITENKELKQFESHVCFLIGHDVLFEKDITLPKKKLNKTDACNKIMYDIFKEIFKTHEETIRLHGLQLEFDKYYARILKQTLEKQEDIMLELQKAQQEGDIGKFEELSDLLASVQIANVLYKYKHIFI